MGIKRRTFLQSSAGALAFTGRGESSLSEANGQPARKPWPRSPVLKLRFDESAIPDFSKMAALAPRPGTKRVYLQQPCDYKIVTARPDLKFQMYDAAEPASKRGTLVTGYGFVLMDGSTAISFDYQNTRLSFENGRFPLLTQRVSQAGFDFEQTSFTTTGPAGRPLLMVRLKVHRQESRAARRLELAWLTVRDLHARFYSHPNEDYIVFEPWGQGWESGLQLKANDHSQCEGETIFNAYRYSRNVETRAGRGPAGSGLVFQLSFQRQDNAAIEFLIPYEGREPPAGIPARTFRASEEARLLALSFDEEYHRQSGLWEQRLKDAAAIDVPEKTVEDIYSVLTCNNLQFLGSAPGVDYLKPGQGGFNTFSTVYGWESSNYLPLMDRQGFHDEVSKVLDYFLTTQQGHHGPEGDISTAEGSFRPHIHWMCETGAILGIFADHAIFSGDYQRLRRDSPSLLRAARWIQGERARTKDLLPDGSRSTHYGLMPPGRATDWPDFAYSQFTDAYTWRGLDKLARAFELAGLSDAGWLRKEAGDYRQCIVASMRRVPLGGTAAAPVTAAKGRAQEKPVLSFPTALLDAGLIPARDDLVSGIESALRKTGAMDDLFAQRMPQMEDDGLLRLQEKSAGGEIDLYYVNMSEKIWHRLWLERGERRKAWRYFYMTLAYSTSRDVHVVSERYCPQLIWLLPWQPNASGNGRLLEMIFNTLYLEDGDSMKLLPGVPDAWFASRQPLGARRIRTTFGLLSFTVKPAAKDNQYDLAYQCAGEAPKRFLVALPDGGGPVSRRIVEVETKGRRMATFLMDASTGNVTDASGAHRPRPYAHLQQHTGPGRDGSHE